MGNCLMLQQINVVKMMKTDVKVLEYKTSMKVEEAKDLPLPSPPSSSSSSPKGIKKVRFADPEVQDVQKSSVVRIKLVISKQKLQDMLENGGISVEKMLSLAHGEKGIDGDDLCRKSDDVDQGWKPVLKSIPEVI
ncbi:uncharacterized protein LOC123890382 [Trifolium pratense]|uniref:Uncharacterized protein n=1 Tax=Trifolium pratense TaxID=57577 RepID=A0ACB0IKR6_TRIPR|nr:uncharacterized protein LOC123890382 [Trifolium pratense]CAJ2632348.1 unnamed protein product [Trifolium pratense]